MLSFNDLKAQEGYAAIISDHFLYNQESFNMVLNNEIEGEIYRNVVPPSISGSREILIKYGDVLVLPEVEEGEEIAEIEYPGSFIREVFFSQEPVNFRFALQNKNMEKLFSPQVRAYYPLNDD